MSVWAECLGSLHLHHKCEPSVRYTNSNNQADILILDSETGSNVELDVVLVHLWAKDILLRAATTGGSAALRREQIKENKYREERLPGGYSPTVVPLVIENFGCWREKAMDYLKVFSTLLRDEHGRSNISEFKHLRVQDSLEKAFLHTIAKLQCRCYCQEVIPDLQEDINLMWTFMSFNSVYVKFTTVF